MNTLTAFLKKKWESQSVRFFVVGIGIVLLIQIIMQITYIMGENITSEMIAKVMQNREWKFANADLIKYETTPAQKESICAFFRQIFKRESPDTRKQNTEKSTIIFDPVNPDVIERKILMLKLFEIKSCAEHNLNFAMMFYKQYYVMIMMVSILGVIATALVAFISKSGWQSANKYVTLIFFIVAAHTLFFYAIPNIFEFQKNISVNMTSYINYANLENRVLTFIVNKDNFIKKDEAGKYISNVENTMEKINNISMSIDTTKLPVNPNSLELKNSAE